MLTVAPSLCPPAPPGPAQLCTTFSPFLCLLVSPLPLSPAALHPPQPSPPYTLPAPSLRLPTSLLTPGARECRAVGICSVVMTQRPCAPLPWSQATCQEQLLSLLSLVPLGVSFHAPTSPCVSLFYVIDGRGARESNCTAPTSPKRHAGEPVLVQVPRVREREREK